MQNINTSYAVFVNRKYNRFGHLFQGRYKAFIVDAVYLSKVLSGKRNADIGTAFGITIQAVTNAARDVEKMREGDGRFNSELKRIKEIVGDSKQSV
jgi:hypothetical protein